MPRLSTVYLIPEMGGVNSKNNFSVFTYDDVKTIPTNCALRVKLSPFSHIMIKTESSVYPCLPLALASDYENDWSCSL